MHIQRTRSQKQPYYILYRDGGYCRRAVATSLIVIIEGIEMVRRFNQDSSGREDTLCIQMRLDGILSYLLL